MRPTRTAAFRLIAAAALSTLVSAQQPESSFRATTDTVLVPVLVTDLVGPVQGLTAADFELLDNGAPQTVTVNGIESRPIDVTLVLDASSSVNAEALARFTADVNTIARSLQPGDRWRLLGFGSRVSQIVFPQAGGSTASFGALDVGGTTAVYDALATALASAPASERPQLVFAFTDGADNISFSNPATLVALAARSNATLYVRLSSQGRPVTNFSVPYLAQTDIRLLRDVADRTGGQLSTVALGDSLPSAFLDALKNFRMRYLLSYRPSNSNLNGWHDIVVRTKDRTQAVRARSGYEQ